jgi:hypothetical protein
MPGTLQHDTEHRYSAFLLALAANHSDLSFGANQQYRDIIRKLKKVDKYLEQSSITDARLLLRDAFRGILEAAEITKKSRYRVLRFYYIVDALQRAAISGVPSIPIEKDLVLDSLLDLVADNSIEREEFRGLLADIKGAYKSPQAHPNILVDAIASLLRTLRT